MRSVVMAAVGLLSVSAVHAEDTFCPDLQRVIDSAPHFGNLRGSKDVVPDMYVSKLTVPNGSCSIITRPRPEKHSCVWKMKDEQLARATAKDMIADVQKCFGSSFQQQPTSSTGTSYRRETASFVRSSDHLSVNVGLRYFTTKDVWNVSVFVETDE
jgi:hypothetical protein